MTAPPAGVRVCAVAELADPGARGFTFEAFRGFVVRRGGVVTGFVDACPHAGGPLAGEDGRYLDRTGAWLICFAHGAMFRPEDGLCVAGPCVRRSLRLWPVRIEGEDVVTA